MINATQILEAAQERAARDSSMPLPLRCLAMKVLIDAKVHLVCGSRRRLWPTSLPAPLPEQLERFLDEETVAL